MTDQTIYAVVDIETTGTDTAHDKIIQFACVLVQNRKIINYFSTDINPLRAIPKHIENLTGISNHQVASAPYFEDIASIITELLSDCVFVAHNVYFDYTFLNSELFRANEKELQISCIDTVELAQILFPKAPGFRVVDLAEYLSLSHDNPHQALSDAYVTAEIFIQLLNKMDTIPLVTLDKMTELAVHLGVDNQLVFKKAKALKEAKSEHQPFEAIKTIDMISLRPKTYQFRERPDQFVSSYPKGESKEELLEEANYRYRDSQGEMMDAIYRFVTENKESKNLMVEVGTGSGKSLGYLFPLSYLLPKKRPIIVSTSTIVLQEQLLDASLPQLEKVINRPINGMILKSSRHFIDLEKFYKTLIIEPSHQKQYIINQMAILSWLLETETGDLDELNLNRHHVFFEQIEHRGKQTLQAESQFIKEDFLIYLEEKKKVADIIFINHAFLCEESNRETPLLPQAEILVVDEAHKLVSILEDKTLRSVSFWRLFNVLRRIRDLEELLEAISELQNKQLIRIIELITAFSLDAREDLQWLESFLINFGQLTELKHEISFDELDEVKRWPLAMKKNVKQLLVIFREMTQLVSEFLTETADVLKEVTNKNYFQIFNYFQVLMEFKQLGDIFTDFFKEPESGITRWLTLRKQHLILSKMDFKRVSIESTSWYPKFKHIIFTSGTLQLDIASHYFENQIQLPTPEKLLVSESFSYKDMARLMVVTDETKIDFSDTNYCVDYLAQVIAKSYRVKKGSMLALFTSHQMLRLVYKRLQALIAKEEVEIFAQGITGTKEKIVKRFMKNKGGIILGANSFWEGVDINLSGLDLIIMTKLPFDPPKRPIVDAKYRYLEKLGKNPFYEEAIPQAGSRLRQGLGRLLRNETDKGVIVVLDSRLTRSSYSQNLLEYLPKGLAVEEVSLNEALSEINSFFTEKDVKD